MKTFTAFAIAVSILGAAATLVQAHDMAAMTATGMSMDHHMVLTPERTPAPQDLERARDLLATLHHALLPYRNYRVALSQGFRIFLPSVPQDVYHFVDYPASNEEYSGHFDAARPGALLYVKNSDGTFTLVGAMYSAPVNDTPDQLDAMVPLAVARWHQHTNICLPDGITLNDLLRNEIGANRTDLPGLLPVSAGGRAPDLDHELGIFADGRFGFTGKIHEPETCASAGGHFLPVAFGWMVHVYPFNGDDLKVAFGMSVPKPISN
jgi:hypothetical protein